MTRNGLRDITNSYNNAGTTTEEDGLSCKSGASQPEGSDMTAWSNPRTITHQVTRGIDVGNLYFGHAVGLGSLSYFRNHIKRFGREQWEMSLLPLTFVFSLLRRAFGLFVCLLFWLVLFVLVPSRLWSCCEERAVGDVEFLLQEMISFPQFENFVGLLLVWV